MPEAAATPYLWQDFIFLLPFFQTPATAIPAPQTFVWNRPALDKDRDDMGLPYRSFPMDANGDVAGGFVFATFNKHLKGRSELFSVWADVLRRQPESVLDVADPAGRSHD